MTVIALREIATGAVTSAILSEEVPVAVVEAEPAINEDATLIIQQPETPLDAAPSEPAGDA
jgi:hypothetical protein